MTRVLVTDGEQRSALAIVRSLGRAGYHPYVCSARRRPLAGASRYAQRSAMVPDPLLDPEAYISALERLAAGWGIELLLPVTEGSLLAVLPARERLAVRIPFGEFERFLAISDKERVLAAAERVGIAVPRQWRVVRPEEVRALALEGEHFPLVIKPSRSIGGAAGARVKLGVGYAASAADLEAQLAALPAAAYPVLLQQRVVGPGIGVFLLVWDGELVASFAHRRLREKPPSGGVSVYSESIPLDPTLLDRSLELLRSFQWSGVAMVEYKVEGASATPYLMEINGRFWGSLQLAIDAGIDFPALLVAACLGRPYRPVEGYRSGVRLRWWWGDMDQLLTRWRHSRGELALPPDAPGRWGALREFLRPGRRGERGEVFRWGDPWPFARETVDWLKRR